ncbi:unnamed protein product [Jaminaea pallidilutea]
MLRCADWREAEEPVKHWASVASERGEVCRIGSSRPVESSVEGRRFRIRRAKRLHFDGIVLLVHLHVSPPLHSELKEPLIMPKQITDIKSFLEIARRKDASAARVKKNVKKTGGTQTKFKVRCSRHLYTLVVDDQEKAAKLQQSLPPNLNVQVLGATKKGSK